MRRPASIFVVALLLVAFGGTALASGPATIIEIDPTGTGIVNTCITATETDTGILTAGEQIVFTGGTVQLVFHEPGGWSDSSGGFHFIGQQISQGLVGEGDLGNTYRITGSSPVQVNSNIGEQDVFTSVGNLHLLSSGSDDNLMVQHLVHFTVNANGDLTVFLEQFRVICNG